MGLTSRLDTAEEKISVLEDIAIETILNESQRDKRTLKNFFLKRAPVSCGTTSGSIIVGNWSP